jgi:hypothetical protein
MPSASDAGQRDPKSLLLQYVHVQRAIDGAKQVRAPVSVCLCFVCCSFTTRSCLCRCAFQTLATVHDEVRARQSILERDVALMSATHAHALELEAQIEQAKAGIVLSCVGPTMVCK